MKVIPREAGKVTYSTEIRKLKKIPLTKLQKSVIVGNILGDGCLCENWSKTNFRMIISHSIKQKEYILWKLKLLKSIILSKPRFYLKNNSLTIRTISHSELTQLRSTFYKNTKKVIPATIKDFLKDPLVIAVWFMDDGNKVVQKGKLTGYHINSQSFSFKENKLLSSCLHELYGIESIVEKNHNGYRLAIWKKVSRLKFRDLIKPHLLESMMYKIG
ncbi:MAG: hypothetical protein AAB635_01345 [Patescibacteria group bacterium]